MHSGIEESFNNQVNDSKVAVVHTEQIDTQSDEITVGEIFLKMRGWYVYLLSKWKVILIAGIIGGVLGLVYSSIKKLTYSAETTFVLQNSDGAGGLANYAGLASMVGIDLSGGGAGDVFQGDNIIELYRSRKMLQKTLLGEDIFNGKKQMLIDRFIEFNDLRSKWSDDPKLAHIEFTGNPERFTRQQDSVVNIIVKTIRDKYLDVEKPDKKLSIISVKVSAKDELFAKSLSDNLVSTVNQFYVNTTTKKSSENLALLQFQADSVKRALNYSIADVASANDYNPNINAAFNRLKVPAQKRQVDVQANAGAYQEILKNLEIAKITLRQNQPLIQIIDRPVFPLDNDKIGYVFGIIVGGIAAGFITTLVLILRRFFANTIRNS